MSDHNLNPHAEARVAMVIWSHEYAYEQKGGSMDFWKSRTPGQKLQCVKFVDKILASRRADSTPRQSLVTDAMVNAADSMLSRNGHPGVPDDIIRLAIAAAIAATEFSKS